MKNQGTVNWLVYYAKAVVVGILLGVVFGFIAYGLSSLTMPWLNSKQLKLIVPWFVMSGLIIGIFVAWSNKR